MSQPVKLGFVGAGYMGQLAHLEKYWKLPGVELVALAEGRAKTAALVAKTYGIASTYRQHRDMLAAADIDAVVAITPFELNAELVEDCLNAGKHIITEKPQVNTAAKGHELAALAERKGLIYQVGYMKRFDPVICWAKQKIGAWAGGDSFGMLLSLRIWCGGGTWTWFREPALDGGDEPVKFDARLEPRPGWMSDRAWQEHIGWINYYSHQTNLARYLIGEDYRLETVKRRGRSAFVQCSYEPSGAQLYLDFYYHNCDRWDEGFEVVFERAKLTGRLPAPMAAFSTAEVEAYEFDGRQGRYERPSLPSVDGFRSQAARFIASIRGDEPPLSPAGEAVKEVAFSEQLVKLQMEQGQFDEA